MADKNDFLLTSLVIGGVSDIAGAYSQSEALKAQGEHEMAIARMNERLAQYNAEDAIQRGNEAANAHRRKTTMLKGKQRAAIAAQGLDPSVGSAADILDETETMSSIDVATIQSNAWREAFGFKSQGLGYNLQGANAQAAGWNAARNTLITGGLNATSRGLMYGYYKKDPDAMKKESKES